MVFYSCSVRRRKHSHAETDVLSTAGVGDTVERVHCSVRLFNAS